MEKFYINIALYLLNKILTSKKQYNQLKFEEWWGLFEDKVGKLSKPNNKQKLKSLFLMCYIHGQADYLELKEMNDGEYKIG